MAHHGRDSIIQHQGAFADILRKITNPLQLTRRLQRRKDRPQIMSHGLAARDQTHNLALHFFFQPVDTGIAGDHILCEFLVIAVYRLAGIQDHRFHNAAHTHEIGSDLVELVCKC